MKKIILVFLLAITIGLVNLKRTYAQSTLTTNYIDNTYAYHYKNGVLRSYGKLPFRYQDGQIVYCIEPDRVINTNIYDSTIDWTASGYSEDEKKQMELIAYYGYEYPGHDSIKYYMATQELIWLFSDDYVKWVDKYSNDGSLGNQINIDYEKNEILNLVKKHNTLPSFSSLSLSKYFGEIATVTDENNVLDLYDIQTDLKYEKQGSTLTFYLNKFGNNNIKLSMKKNNFKKTTVYYVGGYDTQRMASFGLSDVNNSDFSIVVDYAKVRIMKKDIDSKEIIKKETNFNINEIGENSSFNKDVSTSKNGYVDVLLKKGDYIITETKAPSGYIINNDKKRIRIDDNIDVKLSRNIDEIYYYIDMYDRKPIGKIRVDKVDEDGNKLDGVTIGLFDSNHKQISKIITKNDSNYFDNLSLDTYYIRELDTLDGYLLDNKEYKVELGYVDDKTNVVEKNIKIVNNKIRCNIVYISSSNNDKLSGVKINVFDVNNKLVFEGITNNNGEVIIENLPYGKYYIKQIKVPSGYILNKDEYYFYVNDSTCLSKINVENEKTVMPVTTTSINKSLLFVMLFSGLGGLMYVKKNS